MPYHYRPIPITFEKSFASHAKSQFWSKKNKKQPSEFRKSSGLKCLFDCNLCSHEFEIQLYHITNDNKWCGFCANKKLCDKSDCKICFEKSFASHPKHLFWSSKNKKQPREIFKSSNLKYLFDCKKCCHEFEISLNNISANKWCNFCANKNLCDKEDCKTCFDKSFSSNSRSDCWSSKNDKSPRELFKNSDTKCWFDCGECSNEIESILSNISKGQWCPKCINKTETKLYEKMIPLFPSIITQFKQDWSKNIRYLPFDFCIPEPNIIIELDGLQHFKQVSNWKSPEEQFERDKYKEKCANDNDYSTIRILQEDVFNDKYDWCKELCETIENIKNGNKIVNKYLCKNGEYDKFIQNIV